MSKNEHTGDYQQTKPASDTYRSNYDLIFRKEVKQRCSDLCPFGQKQILCDNKCKAKGE